MCRLTWFLFGASFVIALGIIVALIFVKTAHGFSARERPSRIEAWLAYTARSLATPASAKTRSNPVPNTAEVLTEARAHWADHCATCHGNNGNGDTQMGRNFYPSPPDMRKAETQRLTDGELFFIIENGVRMTGMPAWGSKEHGEEDSWKLVHFIRHLPQLTFSEEKEMEKLNPKSPAEFEEEQEEENFLKGEDTHERAPSHHH